MKTTYFNTVSVAKAIFLFVAVSLMTFACKVDEQENASDKYADHDACPNVSLGENVSHPIDTTVILDGTTTADPEGENINFSWVIASKPAESAAVLANEDTLSPSLTLDVTGDFTIQLRADDGLSTGSDTITITSYNTAPVASVGSQSISRLYGATVTLDGTSSSDPDDHTLSYDWVLTSKPAGSTASLTSETTSTPGITFDVTGDYEVSLTVSDGYQTSTKNVKVISHTQKLSDTGLAFRDEYNGCCQDADYTINPPSYKLDDYGSDDDSANDTVRDNNTKLVWYRGLSPAKKKFEEAKAFCLGLNASGYGGYTSGWRVPTASELRGLQDLSHPDLISTLFTKSNSSTWLWSSTTYATASNQAWVIRFQNASAETKDKDSPYYVRCVKGDNQQQNLKDNGDGTVTDYLHGLQWQKGEGGYRSFKEGLGYCHSLDLGGYADWRLPNTKELFSLVDYSRFYPSIDNTIFTDAQAKDYMTSTQTDTDSSYYHIYTVSFWGGGTGSSIGTASWSFRHAYVRCARGGS